MSMPDDVIGEATEYLMIYFSGVSGLMIYNMGAGVLSCGGRFQAATVLSGIFSLCEHRPGSGICSKASLGNRRRGLGYGDCPGIVAVLILVVLFRANGAYRLFFLK